jgi:hypothetical protein
MEQICINPYHYEKIENPEAPKVWVPKNRYDSASTQKFSGHFNLDADLMCPEGVPNRTISFDQSISMEEEPRPSSSTSSAANPPQSGFGNRIGAAPPFSIQSSIVSPNTASQFGMFI